MSPLLPWLLTGLGGALMVAGAAVVLNSAAEPVTVQTGGYAPLEAAGPAAYRSELALPAFDGGVRCARASGSWSGPGSSSSGCRC